MKMVCIVRQLSPKASLTESRRRRRRRRAGRRKNLNDLYNDVRWCNRRKWREKHCRRLILESVMASKPMPGSASNGIEMLPRSQTNKTYIIFHNLNNAYPAKNLFKNFVSIKTLVQNVIFLQTKCKSSFDLGSWVIIISVLIIILQRCNSAGTDVN